jgi:outer membrane protein, heavy metal efflux system
MTHSAPNRKPADPGLQGARATVARGGRATSAPTFAAIGPSVATIVFTLTLLAPARAEALTLDEALSRAEQESSLLRRARAERRAVAARTVGADLLLPANPIAAFSAGPRREDASGARAEGVAWAAHLEQSVEVAGQRGTRRDEVARLVGVAVTREAVVRAETRARVRAAYVGAQLAGMQIRAAEKRAGLVDQLVSGVRARVESGAASQVDLELARVEQGRATRERVTAELARDLALSELRVLVGLPPEEPVAVAADPPRPRGPGSLAALLARARVQRAELKMLVASHDALDATVVRLRREAIPSPSLFLDVQRDLPGQLYVGGGIAVQLPIWRRNQGELALARADRERVEVETTATEREIEAEVARAFATVGANRRIVDAMESQALPAADAAVALVTEGWRAGKFDVFRVIAASREAGDARRNQLESLGALWDAAIALDRATGVP